jgi:hypothetical protein
MDLVCDSVQNFVLFVDDFVAVVELSWLKGVLKNAWGCFLHGCIWMGNRIFENEFNFKSFTLVFATL